MSTSTPALLRIEPQRKWRLPDLRELWAARELLVFLTWRDIKVRYAQTVLGAAWAIGQPLLTMVVFTVFFGRLAGISSGNLPYHVFALAGLVPWTFFANTLAGTANSLVGSASLLTKVYFPRLLVPLGSVLAGLVDLAIAFVVLLGVQLAADVPISAGVVWIPAFVALALVTSLGVGLWLSALNVLYRDVRHVVPFLVQIWLFITPVAYPSELVPDRWQGLYAANPMVGVVEGFRWSLTGHGTAPGRMLVVSVAVALVVLVGGSLFFRRVETVLADVI